jgi:hypothetical protein
MRTDTINKKTYLKFICSSNFILYIIDFPYNEIISVKKHMIKVKKYGN